MSPAQSAIILAASSVPISLCAIYYAWRARKAMKALAAIEEDRRQFRPFVVDVQGPSPELVARLKVMRDQMRNQGGHRRG